MRNFMFLIMFLFLYTGCSESGNKISEERILRSCSVDKAHARKNKDSVEIFFEYYTSIQKENNLIVYMPKFNKIDLVCGQMPSKANRDVLYCAEAAFTGQLLKNFKHSNIAGNHVSGGKYYKGFRCKRNTGAFVWYKGHHKFLYGNYSKEFKYAAQNGGMAFAQELMIHNGQRVKTIREVGNKNEFRALCELSGKLCIIDSNGYMNFGDFIDNLMELGVSEALYLDMGLGWNYSWWRSSDGDVHEIHYRIIAYTTNWITFYK